MTTTEREPGRAQARLLAAIDAGEVQYTQYTGGFGRTYENTRTGDRYTPSTVEAITYQRRWVTPIPMHVRVGGPARVPLTLTDEGRAALTQTRPTTTTQEAGR